MATLTVQDASLSGLDVTRASASGSGDDFPNTGNEYADVNNGSGSNVDVTFAASSDCSFGFTHDAVVSIPAGESRVVGPFSTARFGDSVSVTYSSATSVTIGVVKV